MLVVVVVVEWFNAEFRAATDDVVAKLSTISDRQSRLDARRRRLHVTVTSFPPPPPPCDVIVTSLPPPRDVPPGVVVALSPSSSAATPPATCMRQCNNDNRSYRPSADMACGRPLVAMAGVATTWIGDCLRTGEPSRYITNHQRQLSLPSVRGR